MTAFDQLLHELRDGVERQAEAHTETPAAVGSTDAARIGGRSRSNDHRHWHRAGLLSLLAVLTTLGLGGITFAAVSLLEKSDRVPTGPRADGDRASDGATARRVLPLRVADPAGGLPWGLATFRTKAGKAGYATCVAFGRVQSDQIGVIGRDGTFGNDGRFHPLEPSSSQSGQCGGSDHDGQLLMGGSPVALPASGYSGDPRARTASGPIAGCSNPGETPTARQVTCPSASMRLLKLGFAGNQAIKIVWQNRRARFALTPPAGTSGAYLFVYRADDVRGGGAMQLTTTYRDGTVCHDFSPTPGNQRDTAEQFRRHQRQNPGCQPPPGFARHAAR